MSKTTVRGSVYGNILETHRCQGSCGLQGCLVWRGRVEGGGLLLSGSSLGPPSGHLALSFCAEEIQWCVSSAQGAR